jgi:uncharacterized membrane protein
MTATSLIPMGWFGGLPLGWGLVGVPFWILLIVAIVLLARRRTTTPMSGGTALQLLEERYERGQISPEDFRERRATLAEARADQGRGSP